RLLDRRFHQLGGSSEAQATQLPDHSDSLLARCRDVIARVDRLEHGRNLRHPGRGHLAEDIAVPMYDAPLPNSLWKELRGTLGKPMAGIRGDEPDALQPTVLEMLKEVAPAGLVLLGAVADAEDLPILIVHSNRH